jgi:Fur family iron response transcriptional regulator
MTSPRPYTDVLHRLREAGLRPTRQRLALAKLLFDQGDRHVTAERLHAEAAGAEMKVSLATVYNALHQFTAAGLLREVSVESGKAYFDTNTSSHHHFLLEETGELTDIPSDAVDVRMLPGAPPGLSVARVDVVVRLRRGS